MSQSKIKVAIAGCGFVVDYYMHTLPRYSNLELTGVTELNRERGENFCNHYRTTFYATLDELLKKSGAEILINLTDPHSHFEVSKKALQQGKHVYSEKPTCTSFEHSRELTEIANSSNLHLMTAPCSLLGATAQTLWKSVRENLIGKIRLVYAEMDDGPVHFMNPDKWQSKLGVPWPYENEFTVGCALEHLGYTLTWLVAFFGPVNKMTAYSHCLTPQKSPMTKATDTPDFSVACLEHESGVVTRVTCGIMAPVNRGLRIIGDGGMLSVKDCWDNHGAVKANYYTPIKLKAERKEFINENPILRKVFGLDAKNIPLIKSNKKFSLLPEKIKMDYILGISDLANALIQKKEPVLNKDFCLHVNELTLKIHHSLNTGKAIELETSFEHDALINRNDKK